MAEPLAPVTVKLQSTLRLPLQAPPHPGASHSFDYSFQKVNCLQLRAVAVQGQAQWSLKGLQQESFLPQDKLVLRLCGAVKQTKLLIPRAKSFLENLLQHCMEEDLIPVWYQKWGGHSEAELEQVLMLSKNHIRKCSFFLEYKPYTTKQSLPVTLSQEPLSLTAIRPHSSLQPPYSWGPRGL